MTSRKRKKRDYRAVTALLTREQFIALDGKAFADGVAVTIKIRHIIADALHVPRDTPPVLPDSIFKESNK